MATSESLRGHRLEQYLAFCLEVHGNLLQHKKNLLELGWSEAEAWALCQKVEERLLGPVLDQIEERS